MWSIESSNGTITGDYCFLKPLCPFTTVVCVYDGALAELYALTSTTLVVFG